MGPSSQGGCVSDPGQRCDLGVVTLTQRPRNGPSWRPPMCLGPQRGTSFTGKEKGCGVKFSLAVEITDTDSSSAQLPLSGGRDEH